MIRPPEQNLTKATSPASPVRELPARGGDDDQVHLVAAAPVDVIDPATLRTYCGTTVFEVYNDGREPTCERCIAARSEGGTA